MPTLSLDQALQQAISHHRAGELSQAEQIYRAILQTYPKHPDTLHNLGVLALEVNKPAIALPLFKTALEINPNQARFCLSYIEALLQADQLETAKTLLTQGRRRRLTEREVEKAAVPPPENKLTVAEMEKFVALFNQGNHVEAELYARDLTQRFPNHGFGWKALGAVLSQSGRLEASLAVQKKSVTLLPNDVDALNNLGVTLQELGHLDDAEKTYRLAIAVDPNSAYSYNNLGNTLRKRGRLHEAETNYRQTIAIKPDYALAYNNLAVTLQELDRLPEAESNYRQAIALNPHHAEAYSNLANVLLSLTHVAEAEKNYRLALALNPNYAKAYGGLGNALLELARLTEAEASYRLAITHDPNYAEAHNNLGNILQEFGYLQKAEQCYRTAISIKPDYADAQGNLLFAYNYTAHYSPDFRLAEAKRYGEMVAKKVAQRYRHWQYEAQAKRLRVGFVSGDFRNHSVGHFLENVLCHLQQLNCEMIAYSACRKIDEVTERIKPYFAQWKAIFALNDAAAAKLIHDDGVHILFDLSGHTANNRLSLFAWKPAPIQVTWLGYLATTGVAEMDYILVDANSVPEKNRWHFTEKTCYLPDTQLCFSAPTLDIAITPLPALTKGYITFGCFQNLSKVTDAVLALWSRILAQLPSARLRFQSKQLHDAKISQAFYLRLAKQGIDKNRVSTHGAGSRENYLAAHAEVDFILDTFPYTGCTTTCEALWMGVPTLTLAGDSLIARQGVSLLSAAGLPDWIAADADNYLEKAVAFATDLNKLATLRGALREQVLATPLFDAQQFARNFEHTLEEMWRDYQMQ